MFCINCNKKIPDGSQFCGFCGSSQKAAPASPAQPAPPHTKASASENKARDKTAMLIWIIAAILIVAAIALVLIFVAFPDGIGNNNKPAPVEDRNDEDERDDEDEPEEDGAMEDTEDSVDDTEAASDDTADFSASDTALDKPESELVGTGYNVGDTMYDFSVPTIDGGTFTLSENLGKPVFINVFYTTCPPCRAEMPDIETLYQEYGDTVVFTVIDVGDGLAVTQDFAAEFNYTLPFAYSDWGDFMPNYNVEFFPQTFVLDANGTVIEFFAGMSDYERFNAAIEKALEASQ